MRLLLAAFLLLSTSGHALAEDSTRAKAKAHYDEGEKAFRLGEFQRAVTEFKASYEVSAVPLLLYNVAQAYRQLGDSRQALFFYKQFLATGPNGDSKRVAEQRVAELSKAIEEASKAREAPPTDTVPIDHRPSDATPAAVNTSGPVVLTAPPSEADRRPLHKKAWFWGVIGGSAVVVAAAVSLGVVFGAHTNNPTASDGRVTGN
jgi:tetratricopeptide (TPR) repeat protein